jgi:hypothetical protein
MKIAKVVHIVEGTEDPWWAKEIIEYLKEGKLLNDMKATWKIRMRSTQNTLIEDILYKRGYTLPFTKMRFRPRGGICFTGD